MGYSLGKNFRQYYNFTAVAGRAHPFGISSRQINYANFDSRLARIYLCNLPVAVFGNSVMNSTYRGYL